TTQRSTAHPNANSFPTRRSSDLKRNRSRYIENARRWANDNKEKRREIARNHANRYRNSPENRPVIIARKLLSRILNHTGKKKRRSEEHTSELQSRFDLVCRLLLE